MVQQFIPIDTTLTIDNYPVGLHMQKATKYINEAAVQLKNYLMGKPERSINIFVRGSSGSILGAMLAAHFPNSYIWAIKKAVEESHQTVESLKREFSRCGKGNLNLIIDDHIFSGTTLNQIVRNTQVMFGVMDIDVVIVGAGSLLPDTLDVDLLISDSAPRYYNPQHTEEFAKETNDLHHSNLTAHAYGVSGNKTHTEI